MYFDPKTVTLLRATLDRAWAGLPLSEQANTSRSVLAERILVAAAKGERDPERLRASAMLGVSALKGRFKLPGVIAERSTPDEPSASAPVDTKLWGPITDAVSFGNTRRKTSHRDGSDLHGPGGIVPP